LAPAQQRQTAQTPPADPDHSRPVLELRFEGDFADASEAGLVGTAHGPVLFADGRQGKCAAFDGRGWIDTGFSQTKLGDEFTVECWVNPQRQQSVHADIFGNHVGEGAGFVLQQDGARTNHFYAAYGAGDGRWVITEPAALSPGRWQHVALVKSRDSLRLLVNGVPVAEVAATAPVQQSPMPVAVGLGYTDPQRCFRGAIDDVRIWNRALTAFAHAGIDPAAASETRTQYLHSTPRPAAGPLVRSWTLSTDDTRVTLGTTAGGELAIGELGCPVADHNWITRPVAFGLLPQAEAGGRYETLKWRLADADLDETLGQKLSLRFLCDNPELELTSQWHARPGPGPVHHTIRVTNRSKQPVTIGEQPTFDVDLCGATALYRFHSDGGTPDPVGVYRHALSAEEPGRRFTARTSPDGEFIPYVVFDANEAHGVYVGLEWSFCRIETITLDDDGSPSVRVRAGNVADLRRELAPGETLELRPGFLGCYRGDLDDAGNRLRRWLMRYRVPEILRSDPSYPKVQWNAFGATGKTPGSWDPVQQKFYPLIDDVAPLGFEEVMIDVGWWHGGEPDSDPADWPSGMRQAADYAHEKGMRFGLYWTDNLDMVAESGRRQRAARIKRLFDEYDVDMWRSDCTRGAVIGPSFAATRGFYAMVDALAEEIPNFQWENCSGGGRIKDYGTMHRAVKIFNSDTYSPLHVRQAFYDSSYAFHPMQLEGHLGSTDGRYRPSGVAGVRYAFRSTSMGAPEWFLDAPNGGNGCEPWTQEEKETLKACVETYKTGVRPLVRDGDLYHVFPRPDGRHADGIQYYDPAAGRGVVFLFQPADDVAVEPVRLKGLDAQRMYRVSFDGGTHPDSVKSGAELMQPGLEVHAVPTKGARSELIFFEIMP